jgi:hypothetical protein
MRTPSTRPTTIPPMLIVIRLPTALSGDGVVTAAEAALTATAYTVSAVPSLSMLSPVMTVSSRLGR